MIKSPEYEALENICKLDSQPIGEYRFCNAIRIARRAIEQADERATILVRGRVPLSHEVKDTTDPDYNKRRQSTNPWMLEEVTNLIHEILEEQGCPEAEERWPSKAVTKALWKAGLIVLDPMPIPTAEEIQTQLTVETLLRRASDGDNNFWASDQRTMRDAARVIDELRRKLHEKG